MAIPARAIEQRLYSVLTGDQALNDLLADSVNVANYQIGVYAHVAPYTDSRSRKPPQLPYIVYAPVSSETDRAVCDQGFLTTMIYRLTVWDSESGASSLNRAYAIMDRIQTLLDRTENATGTIYGTLDSVIPTVDVSKDGRTDSGVTALFSIKFME